VDLGLNLQKISGLQHDQELGKDQQAALATCLNDMTLTVEGRVGQSLSTELESIDPPSVQRPRDFLDVMGSLRF